MVLSRYFIILRLVERYFKKIFEFFLVIGVSPIVLLIIAIRPFVIIRFGTMISHRIGHFTLDVEAYLCVLDHDNSNCKTFDIITCPEPVCNQQLQTMWARTLCISPETWRIRILQRACQLLTPKHYVRLYARYSDYYLFKNTSSHLQFTNEEQFRGQELLRKLGVPLGMPWVCIHNRDSTYLSKTLGDKWAYHDFRDFSIKDTILAAKELSQRGYYVLRMGSVVSEPLISNNPKIVDYASSEMQSDFADMYLLANCSGYIGSDAGIACIPLIFRKPVIYINWSITQIGILIYENCFSVPFIIKQLLKKETKRYISLREMFKLGLNGAAESQRFEKAGVEVVSNTAEEIRDLSIEFDERLKNQWQSQPEDEVLQQRFWEIFKEYSPVEDREINVKLGASFLRNNKYLLE